MLSPDESLPPLPPDDPPLVDVDVEPLVEPPDPDDEDDDEPERLVDVFSALVSLVLAVVVVSGLLA